MNDLKNILNSALKALKEYYNKTEETNSILGTKFVYFYLAFMPSKVFKEVQPKPIKLELPNSIYEDDTICLITTTPQKYWEDKLKAEQEGDSPIKRIIDIVELKKKFKDRELKNNLVNSYNIFIADSAVVSQVPSILGNQMFRQGKIPHSIKLKKTKKIHETIKPIYNHSRIFLRPALFIKLRIGSINGELDKIVENAVQGINDVKKEFAKYDTNIVQIRIAFNGGPSLVIMEKPKNVKVNKILNEDVHNKNNSIETITV